MVIFLHSHSYLLAGYPQGSYSHGHRLALPGPARDHARKAPSMAAGGDNQKLSGSSIRRIGPLASPPARRNASSEITVFSAIYSRMRRLSQPALDKTSRCSLANTRM